jgi:hypothetical protein
MSKPPSIKRFRDAVRREFSFLIDDFGFTEERLPRDPEKNAFKVAYANATTRVTVEGINWGENIQVMLFALSAPPDIPARVPLWAIIEVRAPQERDLPGGQLPQITRNAAVLRQYASDVLRGDFSVFPAARQLIDEDAARLATEYSVKKLP